jgi:hypothetical protein
MPLIINHDKSTTSDERIHSSATSCCYLSSKNNNEVKFISEFDRTCSPLHTTVIDSLANSHDSRSISSSSTDESISYGVRSWPVTKEIPSSSLSSLPSNRKRMISPNTETPPPYNSCHQVRYYNQHNLSVMLFNRSGSSLVGNIIQVMNDRCGRQKQLAKEDGTVVDDNMILPPKQQILEQWASDVFYNVVIVRRSGIEAVLLVMSTFSSHSDIIELGCRFLQKLCSTSEKNVKRIIASNGIEIIKNTVQNHPQSISIQRIAQSVTRDLLSDQHSSHSSSDDDFSTK